MTEAKIQHYVPKFLLRNFGFGKKDYVYVYDKQSGRSFQTNAKNVASENRFYDFNIDGTTYSLESKLSQVESSAKPIIAHILDSDMASAIDTQSRVILASFLAIQFVRTRAFRTQWAEFPQMLRRKIESTGDSVAPGSQAEALIQEPTENQIKIDTARMILDAPKTHGPFFLSKAWFLAKTTSIDPFILGDNPISLQNHINMEPYGNLGLAVRGIEIYMPLSPTRALAMWCPSLAQHITDAADTVRRLPRAVLTAQIKEPDDILAIDSAIRTRSALLYNSNHVMNFNSLQVSRSERYLFSSKNDFDLADRMINEYPHIRSGQRLSVG